MTSNHVPKGNKPTRDGIQLSKCLFSISHGPGWGARYREGTKMSVSEPATEEAGEGG